MLSYWVNLRQCLLCLLLIGSSSFASDPATSNLDTELDSQTQSNLDPLPLEDLRRFAEVFERIRSSYVEEVDDQTLFNNAIKGMLSSLDPHSAYLQEDDFSELRETTAGKFGGLGIEVGMENGMIRVITPIDDTPAQRAGINAGDLIVTLDGESVMGLTLNEAIERMRGEPGSDIQLEVQRGSEKKLLSFTITRAEIKVASVRSEMLGNGIGYLRITQFQDKTGSETRDAVTEMKEQQSLQGIILDLRNNPGGVLNAAVEVVDSFISEGLIVYTEGRSKDSDIRYLASTNTIAPNIPMVILINGGSASASEIVAGALQDHKRAVIVGTRSFGKGSVQTILPITETSAVKMTTARYFTPNGRSIQAQGIAPDIDVAQGEVNITEERFYKESDLPGHLSNPDGQTEGGDLNVRDSELLKRDFQLYEAHTLLRGVNVLNLSKQ